MFVLCALSSATASIAQDTGVTARKQKQPKATPGKDPNTFVLVGAGDIAWCGNLTGAEATAKLIDKIPGTAPQDPTARLIHRTASGKLLFAREEKATRCWDSRNQTAKSAMRTLSAR